MQGRNKHDVLLTELVIVILVFSLVAVTVVQMFVAARQKSAQSGRLEHALIVAQDWAERLFGASDPTNLLIASGFTPADGEGSAGEITYVLKQAGDGLIVETRVNAVSTTESGSMFSATVSVLDGQKAEPDAESEGEQAAQQAPLVELPVLRYNSSEEVRP